MNNHSSPNSGNFPVISANVTHAYEWNMSEQYLNSESKKALIKIFLFHNFMY